MPKTKAKRARLVSLKSHPEVYVTIGELAEYWAVNRKQLYKQIEAGTLPAIRLGPRLLRIRTADAIQFESNAKMYPQTQRERATEPIKQAVKLPRRVRRL